MNLHAVLDDVDGAEDEGLRESGDSAGKGDVGQSHLSSAAVPLVQKVHRVRIRTFIIMDNYSYSYNLNNNNNNFYRSQGRDTEYGGGGDGRGEERRAEALEQPSHALLLHRFLHCTFAPNPTAISSGHHGVVVVRTNAHSSGGMIAVGLHARLLVG
jgi:hypothetical protein